MCVSHDCRMTAGYRMRFFDQAAVFTEACLEYGVLPRTKETCILLLLIYLQPFLFLSCCLHQVVSGQGLCIQ